MGLKKTESTITPSAVKSLRRSKAGGNRRLSEVPARGRFLLAYRPDSIRVQYGEVLPVLESYPLQGGVLGIRKIKTPTGIEFDTDALEARLKREGLTLLTDDVGFDDAEYLKIVRVQGGEGFYEAWAEPVPGLNVLDVDEEAHKAFLVRVRDELGAPRAVVLKGLRSKLASQLRVLQNRLPSRPGLAPEVERLEADIAVVDAALKPAKKTTKKADS